MKQELINILLNIVLAGGGAAVIVFAGLRSFADRWLGAKFDAKLEDLRHQQAITIEQIKVQTAGNLDWRLKRQSQEVSALPKIWQSCCEVFDVAWRLTFNGDVDPDFTVISEEFSRRFMKDSDITEEDINIIIDLPVQYRADQFKKSRLLGRFARCNNIFNDAQLTVEINSIFIEPELRDKVQEFINHARQIMSVRMDMGFDADENWLAQTERFQRESAAMKHELNVKIRERLNAQLH